MSRVDGAHAESAAVLRDNERAARWDAANAPVAWDPRDNIPDPEDVTYARERVTR